MPLAIGAAATTFDVADGSSYPTANFFIVLDLGTASEEKCFVGSRSGDTFSIVARGEDGTTAKAHVAGATLWHIGAATDFDESNVTSSALTTKGDVLVKGVTAGPARLPVGANGSVLTADSTAGLGLSYQALVPAGTMLSGCWATAPAGFLMLDGSTVVGGQTLYPNLWAVIPVAWKSGANIVLPDARGRVLAGAGTGAGLTNRVLGTTFGEENHTLTIAEVATHAHLGATTNDNAFHGHNGSAGTQSADHTHAMAGYTPQNFQQMQPSNTSGVYAATSPWTPADGIQTGGISASHNHAVTVAANNAPHTHPIPFEGGGAAHNNMPAALAVSIVIKT